jgi:hypothetical protein
MSGALRGRGRIYLEKLCGEGGRFLTASGGIQ